MSWIKTDSSQIHSLKYDPIEQVMEAKFVCRTCEGSGKDRRQTLRDICLNCKGEGHKGHYSYAQVPVAVYAAVRDDPDSIGAAFNRLIKRGEHVTPAKPFTFRKIA